MMVVTLTTDLRPWRKGDDVVIPDDVAKNLIASGESENPRVFGQAYEDRAMQAGDGRRGYKTKGRRQ